MTRKAIADAEYHICNMIMDMGRTTDKSYGDLEATLKLVSALAQAAWPNAEQTPVKSALR